MDKFTSISRQVFDTYSAKGVELKLVSESVGVTAWYVEPGQTRRAGSILENNIKGLAYHNKYSCGMRYGLPHGGAIVVVSERRLTDQDYRALVTESRSLYGELSRKLDSITMECGTTCAGIANAPAAVEPPTLAGAFRAKDKKKKKDTKEKIQEALDGLATPDDVQPEESLRGLFRAMKDSGLLKRLPEAGIKWHIPPNKHSITFLRNKVPVLQLNLVDLNDDKTLTQTLLSLEAMSSGEAPQANEVTADYIKQLAAKVRDKERQLSQLAAKHAPNTAKLQAIQQQQQMQQLGKPVAPSGSV